MTDESEVTSKAETAGPVKCRLMLLIDADKEIEAWGEIGRAFDILICGMQDAVSAVTALYELHEKKEMEDV